MKNVLLTILLCLFATEVPADSWDEGNFKPYNTDVVLEKTNLPILFINTRDEAGHTTAIHKDYQVAVRMKIINNADGVNYGDTVAHSGQTTNYEGWVGIKYRGSSSFYDSDKKPYGFRTLKTADVNGKKEKVKLLGLPEDNNWVLLAPYHDRSLIRDPLVYQLSRPYFEFTPKCKFCEIIVDGIYYGVYILCEKPSKGKNRLNFTAPGDSGDELTGDYMVEIDRDNEPHFVLKYKMYDHDICAKYHFPDYEEMSSEQMAYIKQRFDELEDVLSSDGFADKENGYSKYIDVENFINYQLMTEFCQNPDGYRLSTYIYKRRDSVDPRFKITPWDYNMTFGNNIAAGDFLYEQWVYEKGQEAGLLGKLPVPFWWKRLTEDEAYWKRMKERWAELRTSTLSDQHVTEMMDSLVNEVTIGGACERNYQAWPIWDKEIPLAPTTATNYDEEIALMREWTKKQVAWIDEQLVFDPTGIISIQNVPFVKRKDNDDWYDLQGRKFATKPTARGIYIHQGKFAGNHF